MATATGTGPGFGRGEGDAVAERPVARMVARRRNCMIFANLRKIGGKLVSFTSRDECVGERASKAFVLQAKQRHRKGCLRDERKTKKKVVDTVDVFVSMLDRQERARMYGRKSRLWGVVRWGRSNGLDFGGINLCKF